MSNTNMYIGALVKLLAIFFLNALFKDFFQAIVQVFYEAVQGGLKVSQYQASS